VLSLDFARDGRTVASGGVDGTVRLWDIETGTNIRTISVEDSVFSVAISPDNRLVAAGISGFVGIRVWDIETGHPVQRLKGPDGHKGGVFSVEFSSTGRELVSGSWDSTIKIWELPAAQSPLSPESGRCLQTFIGHEVYLSLFNREFRQC
jgi:glucose repression regulatory protein TUP1